MKKQAIWLHTLLLACLIGVHSHADNFSIYAGAGIWNTGFNGEIGTDSEPANLGELGIEKELNAYYFLGLEHAIPVLPNLRLGMTKLATEGTSTVTRDIVFDNITVPSNADTQTEIDFSHIDYIFYYQLIDNWVELDLGLNARQFNGSAMLSYQLHDEDGNLIDSGYEKTELDGIMPLLYLEGSVELPFSNTSLQLTIQYLDYREDSALDYQASIIYMSDGLGLDVGFEVGYRGLELTSLSEDSADLSADLSIDGIFSAVRLKF